MGRAKAQMMEHEDNLNAAAAYLVEKEQLVQCDIHDEIYADNFEIDPDFWPIAMSDKKLGENGPVPWADGMPAREFTDLLKSAWENHCGDGCGYCEKNAAE